MEARSTSPQTGAEIGGLSPRGAKIAWVLGLLVVGGLSVAIGSKVKVAVAKQDALASERAAAAQSAQRRVPYLAAAPTPLQWKPRVEVTGTLRPWREADLGFELGGRLVSVAVAQGDKAKAGQTLAVIDGSQAEAQASAADAQARAAAATLQLAQDDLRRSEALYASKTIALAEVEETKGRVTLARAQLDGALASARVARTGAGLHKLSAPFAGLVTKAPTAAGSVVQPGSTLLRLEDLSRFRLSAAVGEEDAPVVKIGAAVTVVYRDRKVTGRVVTVVPSLDQATRRVPIEVEVDNDAASPLLAYSFVRATIEGQGEVSALRLPTTARRPGSQDEIVKNDNGKALILHVAHAVDADGSWIVMSGLAPTDVIVLSPSPDLRDGDPIEVAK